jgi:uncharacterized Zn-binding protein involved in type VI secretion
MKPIGLFGAYCNHDIHPVPVPKPAPAGVSANVIINGLAAHHGGNTFVEHTIPMFPPPPLHADVIISGHPTVWINGAPAAMQIESEIVALPPGIGAGSLLLTGSHTVFMGDATPVVGVISDGEVSFPEPEPPATPPPAA